MVIEKIRDMSQHRGTIYAYTTPAYRNTRWTGRRRGRGLVKVGYTSRDAHVRIREQIGASSPEKNPYDLLLTARATRRNGTAFSDKDVHRALKDMGVRNVHNEWFEAEAKDVRAALKRVQAKRVRTGSRRAGRKKKRPAPFRRIKLTFYSVLTITLFAAAVFPRQAKTAGHSILSLALEHITLGG
jgi:hypothetical protein